MVYFALSYLGCKMPLPKQIHQTAVMQSSKNINKKPAAILDNRFFLNLIYLQVIRFWLMVIF